MAMMDSSQRQLVHLYVADKIMIHWQRQNSLTSTYHKPLQSPVLFIHKTPQRRHKIMATLPKIDKNTKPDLLRHLKTQTSKMEGKTIKTVKFGIREHHTKLHQSDVLLLEFTDGSILSMQTGSNASNITDSLQRQGIKMEPDEFHTDFVLIWADEDTETPL